jgi:predicted nuclease of predicted toxin-antitoxin system
VTVRLASLFPNLIHVRDIGLKQASDQDIWAWAKHNSSSVITADADFVALFNRLGPPPKLIHLERCDFPFHVIEELLRQNAIRISEFDKDPNAGLLILRSPFMKTVR